MSLSPVLTTPVPLPRAARQNGSSGTNNILGSGGSVVADVVPLSPPILELSTSSLFDPSAWLAWLLEHRLAVALGVTAVLAIASLVGYYAWKAYQKRTNAAASAKLVVEETTSEQEGESKINVTKTALTASRTTPTPPLPEYETPVKVDHREQVDGIDNNGGSIYGEFQSEQGMRLTVKQCAQSTNSLPAIEVTLQSPTGKRMLYAALYKKWETLPVFVSEPKQRPMFSVRQVASGALEVDSEMFRGQTQQFDRVVSHN